MKLTENEFLKIELERGVGFHNPQFVNLANDTASQLSNLDIKTIIDYGAGTGVYSQAFADKGYDVKAFDIWEAHQQYIKENTKNVKLIKRLTKADCMLFIEVAEHMTDEEIITAINKINPQYIIFSSTSERNENDEMWGHINIKEQDQWISFLNKLGYSLLSNLPLPTAWTKIFKK